MKKKLGCVVDEEVYKKFEQKAKSYSLQPAVYLRNLIISNLHKEVSTVTNTDIQKSILAIIPVMSEAFGITQRVSKELRIKLKEALIKVWEEEYYKKTIN